MTRRRTGAEAKAAALAEARRRWATDPSVVPPEMHPATRPWTLQHLIEDPPAVALATAHARLHGNPHAVRALSQLRAAVAALPNNPGGDAA